MTIRGHGGFLGFGQQVAYDTPVALSHFIQAKSLGIQRRIDRNDVDNLGYPGEAPVAHDSYEVAEVVEGTTVHHLGYDDPTMLLLEHCFGSVVDSGAGPYDHEYTLTDDVPAGTEGLTLHQAYGSGPLANRAETFTGCVVRSFSIEVAHGEMAVLEIDWIGKTSGGPIAPAAATLVDAPNRAKHQHVSAAGLTIGGQKVDQLQKFKLSVNKQMGRVDELGDLATQKPVPTGMFEVMLELEWLWTGNGEYTGHLNGTFAAAQLTMTDGTNGYVLEMPRTQIGPVDRKTDGTDKLRCSATLKGYATITDGVITLTLTNSKATTETL